MAACAVPLRAVPLSAVEARAAPRSCGSRFGFDAAPPSGGAGSWPSIRRKRRRHTARVSRPRPAASTDQRPAVAPRRPPSAAVRAPISPSRKIARAMERLDQLAGQSKALVTRSDRSPKVVQRLKAKSAQMREVLESVEFLVSELAMAFKFQMRAPRDQWEKLEVEYASLQQVAQQLLPFCRAAVKNLPQ